MGRGTPGRPRLGKLPLQRRGLLIADRAQPPNVNRQGRAAASTTPSPGADPQHICCIRATETETFNPMPHSSSARRFGAAETTKPDCYFAPEPRELLLRPQTRNTFLAPPPPATDGPHPDFLSRRIFYPASKPWETSAGLLSQEIDFRISEIGIPSPELPSPELPNTGQAGRGGRS